MANQFNNPIKKSLPIIGLLGGHCIWAYFTNQTKNINSFKITKVLWVF
jgi:hypothetical protein